jgi:hypothetical protein
MFQQAAHVAVGGVHLVYYQQATGEAGAAQVGVLGLHRGKQGLVNSAYRNGGGEEALWMFDGPNTLMEAGLRIVLPDVS